MRLPFTPRVPDGAPRPFDHTKIRGLREYGALLRAVEAFSLAPHGLSANELTEAVRDMASLLRLQDACPRCSTPSTHRYTPPHAATAEFERINCRYRCARCSYEWHRVFSTASTPIPG